MSNPGCCFAKQVCLMWLLWCWGGSTVDQLREDECRIVVVFIVVFVLVVQRVTDVKRVVKQKKRV